MDLNDFVKVFDRLLPRSKVWNLVFDRPLRQFFQGLASLPLAIYDHAASIFLDNFPNSAARRNDMSIQFGFPYLLTQSTLEAEFKQTGGQTPKYFQDMLHAAGFPDCFVHEWPVPNTDPVEARDPIALVSTSQVLVNDIGHIEPDYLFQFGDEDSQFEAGGGVYFGGYSGYMQLDKAYPCPDIESEYPNYFYVCGATWPDFATIPYGTMRRLKKLIYKLKPMNLRVILRAVESGIVGDYDIQDTIDHPIIFTDQKTDPDPEETIQDYY
jgi:hypothetical protein